MDEPSRQRVVDLAQDFPRVWNDRRTSALQRKKMLSLMIEDVTLISGSQIAVHVRWRGGKTQSIATDTEKYLVLAALNLVECVATAAPRSRLPRAG